MQPERATGVEAGGTLKDQPGVEDRFSIGPVPDGLLQREVNWDCDAQPGEHAVFLFCDLQFLHGRRTVYERNIRKILTPEAVQKLSHVEIDYDPQVSKLCVHEVRLVRGGQSRSFAERNRFYFRQREGGMDAQILNGRVSAIVLLDDVRTGDFIEVCYSIVTTRELEGNKIDCGFLLERTVRTLAWHVAIHFPKDEEPPAYRQSDGGRVETAVHEREGESIWSWSGSQAEPVVPEQGIPCWEPALRWAQLSAFKSWEEFYLAPVGAASTLVQQIEASGFEADLLRTQLVLHGRKSFAACEAQDLRGLCPDIAPMGEVRLSDDRRRNLIRLEARYQFKEWGRKRDKNLRIFEYNARWFGRFLSCPAQSPPRKRNFMLRFPLNIKQEVVVRGADECGAGGGMPDRVQLVSRPVKIDNGGGQLLPGELLRAERGTKS